MSWVRVVILLAVVSSVGAALLHLKQALIEQGRQLERRANSEAAAERVREALRAGSQMAAIARNEATQARTFASALQREMRHEMPVLVEPAACGAAAAAESAGPARPAVLTERAVSVWDSALAGQHVPAGAGGPADAAAGAGAVAAAAVYTVDDAWDNHIENAALCRQDRARHRQLIEYLQRQARAAP
jgi:hypothetical protein